MALYFPQTKCLILHIPRTGGTFACEAAKKLCPTVRTARARYADHWHAPFWDIAEDVRWSAVFVRHPVDWYESYWRRYSQDWPDMTKWRGLLLAELQPCHADTFNGFISGVLDKAYGFVSRMYEQYCGPPTWPAGQSCVPVFQGRYEHLYHDLAAVLRRCTNSVFGAETLEAMPLANVSKVERPRWDDLLREQIIQAEQPAIQRWYSDESFHHHSDFRQDRTP